MAIPVKLLRLTSQRPQYMSAQAAGADVFADLGPGMKYYLSAGETCKIPVGFSIAIPVGYVGLLKGRSGMASEGNEAHVAAIDPDYRGEVCVIVHASTDMVIKHGERVGQLLIVHAPQYDFEEVEELTETARGSGGFGHTGK